MNEPIAWLIVYGERREHRCLVLERARAEQTAAQLHGVLVPLVPQAGFENWLAPKRARPHVFKKDRKARPPLRANGDAAPTIARPLHVIRVTASLKHSAPCAELRCR